MPHPTSIPTHSKRFPPDNQRNPGDDHFPPDLSLTHPPQPTCPPGCIGRPCPPRFPNGCPSPTFPTPTLPLSAHSISDPYDSSTTSLPSDSSPPPDSATTYSSHPSSTVTGSASSLFTSTGTLTTYSTIQSTLTATATWTRTSLAATGVTTTLLSSDPWPTGPVIVDPDDHSLGLLSVLGIVLGVLLALVLVALFLFLLRRGTFGSGTLLGFKYGDARFEGLSRTGRDMKETRAGYAVNPFDDPSHTTLPSYPSSTSTASHVTLPFLPPSKHRSRSRSPSPTLTTTTTTTTRSAARSSEADSATLAPSARATASLLAMGIKPPLSPVAWSTSPSAFDNVYGRVGAGAGAGTGARGPRSSTSASVSAASASASVADSSDVATLVSQPRYTSSSLSYAPGAVGRATSPAPTLRTVDSADTLRTRETAGASTIDGVRISSWHSSDSEETELIGRTSRARYG